MANLSKFRPVAIICAVIVPAAIWVAAARWFDASNREIVVSGTIQAKEIAVGSRIGGKIAKLLVQEGQVVRKGQSLVEFEEPELDARHKELESAIDQAAADLLALKNGPRRAEIERAEAAANQAFENWQMLQRGYRQEEIEKASAQTREAEKNLDLLRKGYRSEEVQAAKNQVEQAKVELEWAHRDYLRMKALSDQGAVSTRDTDQLLTKEKAARAGFDVASDNYSKMTAGPRGDEIRAAEERLNGARSHHAMMKKGPREEEIASARHQYLQAKATLTLLQQGTRFEDIKRGEARLAQAKANLAALDAQLKDRVVFSPADAEVSVMDLHEGEIIPAGKTLGTLTRLDMVWTRVYVPERELSRVRIGETVKIKVDAFPNKAFHGKIVQIPGVAEFTPRNVQTPEERSAQVFGLKVNVDNNERLLRGGMNADVILPPVAEVSDTVARHVK
jgi:HlyD family secretion protein